MTSAAAPTPSAAPLGAPPPAADGAELYRWQLDALASWLRCGRRGVIEAVTGSGKTDVAIAAVADALRRGRFALVVVPTRVLMEQWHGRLAAALPGVRIGRLGDSGTDLPEGCDVLVATRHSAASHRPQPPAGRGGLLVADECHGLGGGVLRRALLTSYDERLGLTATLERGDDAVADLLLPYFGGICHRYGFAEAIADGVCARPRVAFVGVALADDERAEYLATEQQLVSARQHLRRVRGMPLEPFGDFFAAVSHLAERDAGPDGRAAREYLDAFAKRRRIVADSRGKYELLGRFARLLGEADGALLFTETVRGANHAINRLDPYVSIELITGSTARVQRREILDDLRARRLDVVAAPRVLDEGVDVPDANLGIVLSASRTRRQMIQRMGRILRRKPPGVGARFVIVFARDTLEDPEARGERDGFLDEVERVAEASARFDDDHFDELEAFLSAAGTSPPREPERLEDVVARLADAGVGPDLRPLDGVTAPPDELAAEVERRLGAVEAYAYASFARAVTPGPLRAALWRRLADRLPPPAVVDAPYLDAELAELPDVRVPKVEPKRLSTGDAPLRVVASGDGWQLQCTGCGEASPPVQFRWQVQDQTVDCRCA